MENAGQRVLIAFSIVLILLGMAAAVTTYRLKQEVARLQGERAAAEERERVMDQQLTRERVERLEAGAALRRERTMRSVVPGVGVVDLQPGPPKPHTRSPEITIGPDDELVTLALALPGTLTAPTYRAGLRSAPGDEFWTQSRVKAESDRRVIVVRIPASALPPSDYELGVQGIRANGERSDPVYYYFAVKSG